MLIDGRSVYTPLFAGIYWEVQDTLLEDIDRIEVDPRPGRDAVGRQRRQRRHQHHHQERRGHQGGLLTGGGGNEERGFGGAATAARIGENFHYRVYGKYFDRDGGFNPDGPPTTTAGR